MVQDLHGSAEDLTNSFPMGIAHPSADDDEQVTMIVI